MELLIWENGGIYLLFQIFIFLSSCSLDITMQLLFVVDCLFDILVPCCQNSYAWSTSIKLHRKISADMNFSSLSQIQPAPFTIYFVTIHDYYKCSSYFRKDIIKKTGLNFNHFLILNVKLLFFSSVENIWMACWEEERDYESFSSDK